MDPPAQQEVPNQPVDFGLIHTTGNHQIRALGLHGWGRPRWWTFILKPIDGFNPEDTNASITTDTVKSILAPTSRYEDFSILRDTETSYIVLIFHSKRTFERAESIIAQSTSRLFLWFDIVPLNKVEPANVRTRIDGRLGSYLKAVQGVVPETTSIVEQPPAPPPALDNAAPRARANSTRLSKSALNSTQHITASELSNAAAEAKSWRDANSHLRDIVNNMSLIHPTLRDGPAISVVLDDKWTPSIRDVDSTVRDAIEELVDRLPDPSDDPKAPIRLETAMKQAAALCGSELSLEFVHIDDSSEEEEQVIS